MAYRKLQIRRGIKKNLPTLSQGELGFCTDTKELFIGDSVNNHQVGMLNNVYTKTQVNDKLYINDTRNENNPPSWYYSKKSKTFIIEFKNISKIQAPLIGTYCQLITYTPWTDSSGGYPVQFAFSDKNSLYIRYGISDSVWSSWQSVVLGDDKRLSNSRPASDVYAWAKESTKPKYTANEVGAYTKTEIDNKFTEKLTKDITVYVSTTGNDSTGDGSNQKPYRTINYALSKIPKNLNGYRAYVQLAEGTYNEQIHIEGYTGVLNITGAKEKINANKYKVNSIACYHCKNVCIRGINFLKEGEYGTELLFFNTSGEVSYCIFTGNSNSGLRCYYSYCTAEGCDISNTINFAISVFYAMLSTKDITGSNNTRQGFWITSGIVFKGRGFNLQAPTMISKQDGGQIFG